jgi:TIR domain/Pentapeptide repeats (8 copies)
VANEEHLAILKKGVEAWNEWREKNRDVTPDLSGAELGDRHLHKGSSDGKKVLQADGANFNKVNLSKANLGGACLTWANLREANLAGAHLSMAKLEKADLYRADLTDTHLFGANFRETNLREANFLRAELKQADLPRADLRGANLMATNLYGSAFAGADLTGVKLYLTNFGNNDLSEVMGLETAHHGAPSTIGIDTIYKSNGKLPEVFLRGAGVPEEFITYMKSLVANPIEFYSCFISYSTKDQEFAERLHGDLQNKNVRCWFAPHDVQGGKKLHEQIDEAIRVHEKVLLILSVESMNSEWVKTEIAKARRREGRERKQVLFPVRLVPFEAIRDWECFDADAGKDSAREIREYFIPDFSEWKEHDKYKKAFERLLGDLKWRTRTIDAR